MVKLVCSFASESFVFDTTTDQPVDSVTAACAEVHNLRMRVKRLVAGVKELAKYGPMKPEDKRGLSDEQISGGVASATNNTDPNGIREGVAPNATVAETMVNCATEAENSVSDALTKRRVAVDVAKVQECIQNIKGSVMMAYPMGLPAWDTVQLALDDNEDLNGQEASKYVLDPKTCSLWFAGKQMMRDEVLSKYVGKNEKCIIQCKFTHKGSGAPQRPPAVDEETQKKMMAFWHKKQEQQKTLEEDDEDAYLNSAWANPKAFKQQMNGLGGAIRWR